MGSTYEFATFTVWFFHLWALIQAMKSQGSPTRIPSRPSLRWVGWEGTGNPTIPYLGWASWSYQESCNQMVGPVVNHLFSKQRWLNRNQLLLVTTSGIMNHQLAIKRVPVVDSVSTIASDYCFLATVVSHSWNRVSRQQPPPIHGCLSAPIRYSPS